jgi:hypothetical protein
VNAGGALESIRNVLLDCGALQHDALRVDRRGSLEAYAKVLDTQKNHWPLIPTPALGSPARREAGGGDGVAALRRRDGRAPGGVGCGADCVRGRARRRGPVCGRLELQLGLCVRGLPDGDRDIRYAVEEHRLAG